MSPKTPGGRPRSEPAAKVSGEFVTRIDTHPAPELLLDRNSELLLLGSIGAAAAQADLIDQIVDHGRGRHVEGQGEVGGCAGQEIHSTTGDVRGHSEVGAVGVAV